MAKKSIDAKVRPLANPSLEKASLLGAARLYISKDSLIALTGGLENGKTCVIEKAEGDTSQDGPQKREAALWVLTDKNVSPNVIMMSRAFQDATGFKIGDQVRISMAENSSTEAEEVIVRDVSPDSKDAYQGGYKSKYDNHWSFAVGLALERAEQVFPGMVLEGVSLGKLRRTYKVVSVNSQQNSLARFDLDASTVRILQADEQDPVADGATVQERGDLILKDVPGFTKPVELINDFLWSIGRVFQVPRERASSGFVIHGGHGTGKTFILQRIADTNWGKVHWIKPAEKLTTIREIFQQAIAQQPSMILIDSLHELIPQERSNREAVIDAIGEGLDTLSSVANAKGGGRPSVVVLATCLDFYTDVPLKLQSGARFYRNVVLPIPRAPQRLEILNYHKPHLRPEEKEACLLSISQKTHAFSCQDLSSLVYNANDKYEARMRRRCMEDPEMEMDSYLSREDMEYALQHTRPTAMHDINLQPPVVHWKDVGGQESVKKALARMIKYTKDMDPSTPRVLSHPPKGLLLYGPPGCSKTLSAQAMATESSFNFFAVKGAELLNMYVGESERAVRSLFLRARAAAPSIIFFDEIDSIGGQRSEGGGARSTGSVNVLTTLLTEMDGFEALSGVLIIAATNRPDAIDPALLRPGRFDRAIYVGLPDFAARESIFRINLGKQPLAADVDFAALAARSEGYSGAEIKHICSESELTVQERYDDDETGTVKLEFSMADIEEALAREPKNTTAKMLDGYTRWMQQLNGRNSNGV